MESAFKRRWFEDTLCDQSWLEQNRTKLLGLFPDFWATPAEVNWPVVISGLSSLGLELSDDDVSKVLALCEIHGIVLRDGCLVRRGRF